MIASLFRKYPGSTIAIIGASPSKLNYTGKEDLAIALNAGIDVDYPVTHHMMFDRNCPRYDWWKSREGVTRLIGSNLAPRDPYLYEEPIDWTGNHRFEEWLESHPPQEPHCFWYFDYLNLPPDLDADTTWLAHHSTVAHPAVELAYRMGASRINMYGIELATDHYTSYAPYMNKLIEQIKKRGTRVFRTPAPSRIQAADVME